MKKLLYILLFFILGLPIANCQILKIDSLLALIKIAKEDTNKVNHINDLCIEYIKISKYDKGLQYGNIALALGKKLNYPKGIASSYNKIGAIYANQGNYAKALENHFASLKIFETINDKRGVAYSYGSIGGIYLNQGIYDKALESYVASLKIKETIGDKKGIAGSYGSIGLIYRNQGNYAKALENFFASLKIYEAIDDKHGIASSYHNIGTIYTNQGNYTKALENFFASLKTQEAIGNKHGIASSYYYIGIIYAEQGSYTKALENFFASLKIYEAIGNKNGIAVSYSNIGIAYLKQGNISEAKKQLLASLTIAQETHSKDNIKYAYKILSLCDSAAGNFKGAYEYHKLYKEMNDSIFNDESSEKTAKMSAMYESEKKEAQIKLLEKDKEKQTALAVVEKKKQLTILYSVIGGLFLVIIFAGFMYNRFKVTQKQKIIIEEKERETHAQKEIIEEKHKEITDSINYAERIQRSFMATREILDEYLGDYFVFFCPKDVVSGDFYWAAKLKNGNFAFTCADSTGHGVPGAIMSILNISSLEKSIEQETDANQILNQTRKIIIERLKKDGSEEGGKDGMDCSLLVINKERTQLSFAAANNPVFIVRNKELLEFKPDKMPVGKHDKDNEPFTLQIVQLQKGDVIYTFTDGFPDQFGGEKGKKYMVKDLKRLIMSISSLPMLEQEQKFAEEFNLWKGQNDQVDDVCIIGLRV